MGIIKQIYLILAGIIIGVFIYIKLRAWYINARNKRRFRIAQKAENDAVGLLQKNGYHIVDIQKKVPVTVMVDDKSFTAYIQADLLVEKAGKSYVVEVKSGEVAPQISNRATRRQLLEYYLTYRTDGALLVDMKEKEIHRIEFVLEDQQDGKSKRNMGYILFYLLGLMSGLALLHMFK